MVNISKEYQRLDDARKELRTCKSYCRRRDLRRFIDRTRREIQEAKRWMAVTKKEAENG